MTYLPSSRPGLSQQTPRPGGLRPNRPAANAVVPAGVTSHKYSVVLLAQDTWLSRTCGHRLELHAIELLPLTAEIAQRNRSPASMKNSIYFVLRLVLDVAI